MFLNREEKLLKLTELISKFERNINEYKSKEYKEANLRTDFLNPFFEILDWDVKNESGKSEHYRDVIIEDRLEIAGSKRVPDFCFKIGKERKFYCEAKKPAIDIKNDIEPSLQVRRYGYTAGLPLCILTDFEEFAVYDTSIKPHKNDKSSSARIKFINYKDYINEFDYIYNTFSKTAIEQGSFDKYTQSAKNKKGTQSLDKGLLELVENSRILLAKNISKLNDIDKDSLNSTVIKIIDRIMFLRISEDKRVEPYGTLLNAVNSANVYKNVKKTFVLANERYNSGLFEENKIIDSVNIDDKVLKDIILSFYHPECPYEFSVLPVSILGNIYEQFLGQTIRQTESGMVKVEEKPQARKAGGVYYTPEYIVDYIVRNTVGEKIKRMTPKEIEKVKILDPACGSGSFLINAYQYLLDYHLEYYTKANNIKSSLKSGVIAEGKNKDAYRLSIPEKQKILKNNIFGVDIDEQAVEVSRFSLLVKLMETENNETTEELFTPSHYESKKGMRLLPDLADNIKCGNSLIGKDFLADNLMLDNEEVKKVNPFDWQEGFPEIMKNGGFDAIIGNPPYGAVLSNAALEYIDNVYHIGVTDSYDLFIIKAIHDLLKEKSFFGFIVPRFLQFNKNAERLRKILLKTGLLSLTEIGMCFEDANTECMIFVYNKSYKARVVNSYFYYKGETLQFNKKVNKSFFESLPNCIFNVFISNEEFEILQKILNNHHTLSGNNPIGLLKRGMEGYKLNTVKNINNAVNTIAGGELKKYFIDKVKSCFVDKSCKEVDRLYGIFKKDKILIRRVANKLIADIDYTKRGFTKNLYAFYNSVYDLKFVLGLINSKLLSFFLIKYFTTRKEDIFPEIVAYQLEQLPIPKLDLTKNNDRIIHDKIISLVDTMLIIQKQFYSTKIPKDKEIYQQKADIIDDQINKLVYKLYRLTDNEIKIVEGTATTPD
jgi:type I restriction-modification system DNA methylase subunit